MFLKCDTNSTETTSSLRIIMESDLSIVKKFTDSIIISDDLPLKTNVRKNSTFFFCFPHKVVILHLKQARECMFRTISTI